MLIHLILQCKIIAETCLWELHYGLSFWDERDIIVNKVGGVPDKIRDENKTYILEWESDMYNIIITFDTSKKSIASVIYLANFINVKI